MVGATAFEPVKRLKNKGETKGDARRHAQRFVAVSHDLAFVVTAWAKLFPKSVAIGKLEIQIRKSGENQGKLAPHFHLLVWGVPLAFDYHPERGKHYRVVENCHAPVVWRTDVLVEGQFVSIHLALNDEL